MGDSLLEIDNFNITYENIRLSVSLLEEENGMRVYKVVINLEILGEIASYGILNLY